MSALIDSDRSERPSGNQQDAAEPSNWLSVQPGRAELALPLVCDSPHSGTRYPDDFGHAIHRAALRAAEMGCDALLKGTQVDGVYSADPRKNPAAERYATLTYLDMLARDLAVMDAAAISLARENRLPIVVFNIRQPGNLAEVLEGRGTATDVKGEQE